MICAALGMNVCIAQVDANKPDQALYNYFCFNSKWNAVTIELANKHYVPIKQENMTVPAQASARPFDYHTYRSDLHLKTCRYVQEGERPQHSMKTDKGQVVLTDRGDSLMLLHASGVIKSKDGKTELDRLVFQAPSECLPFPIAANRMVPQSWPLASYSVKEWAASQFCLPAEVDTSMLEYNAGGSPRSEGGPDCQQDGVESSHGYEQSSHRHEATSELGKDIERALHQSVQSGAKGPNPPKVAKKRRDMKGQAAKTPSVKQSTGRSKQSHRTDGSKTVYRVKGTGSGRAQQAHGDRYVKPDERQIYK